MSQGPDSGGPLPPYFSISPDEALAELDAAGLHRRLRPHRRPLRPGPHRPGHPRPRGQRRAASCGCSRPGRSPIPDPGRDRALPPGAARQPALPQGRSETAGGAKWFTLDEVLRLRAHFAAEGSRAKEYRPYRPAGLPAKVCAIANFKGGVGKTSMAAHLAMSAALDGYRVLVIDLDSQGSMTTIFGGTVACEWDTVFPLIARDYALGLQAENRRRAERGDPPLPFEDTLAEALNARAATSSRRPTGPTSTSIGAQLNLYWAEFQIPVWRMSLRGWKLWEALVERARARRHPRRLRHRHPRYPAGARLSHHQRPHRRRHPAWCRSAPRSWSSIRRAASSTCCTRPSRRSRTARTPPPAPSAATRSASNGTRSAPSSPATTPASRPSSPG